MTPTKRILMVDDDVGILNALESLLSKKYDVVACEGAENALQKACNEDFDVILLDLLMPNLNGTEFLKKLSACGKNIPVIIMTASSNCLKRLEDSSYNGLL